MHSVRLHQLHRCILLFWCLLKNNELDLLQIKSEIARRILSEKKEKFWTVKECYFEIDNLRNKYSEENDEEKLKFLDQLNDFVMLIQKKYENS